MVSYKGIITTELADSMLDMLEERLTQMSTISVKLRKKTFNVFIEVIQNLSRHHIEGIEEDSKFNESPNISYIVLRKEEDGFVLFTANYIENAKVQGLNNWLNEVNACNEEELRKLYSKVLSNNSFSSKGGAGLGFIDIKRKSGEKLIYQFNKVDDTFSVFEFSVKIPNE